MVERAERVSRPITAQSKHNQFITGPLLALVLKCSSSHLLIVFFFLMITQAFANMTMNVRQELCAVMVFAVVEKAGSVVMENEEEVSRDLDL